LSDLAGGVLIDRRTGKNGRHGMTGLFPPVRVRSPWWLRRRQRRRPSGA
jgi:hypothetical protein